MREIKGGLNVDNEICQNYLLYYPRVINFKHCESFPDINNQYEMLKSLKEYVKN